jgi:hypothetical protein
MKRHPVAILLILAGCASQPAVPDWVSGEGREYPVSQYLVGRGQGPSGEEARDRARGDLAKILEAEVSVASADEQSFRDSRYETASARRVEVRAQRLVEGIEIARTWQDPHGGHYALALLPRLKAANALREEIARLDEATRIQAARSRAAPDLFAQIAAAGQALSAQLERAAHQKTLRVIDPTGVGAPPSWNVERLRADFQALLARVRVRVRADGKLEPFLRAAVASSGFTADAAADYVLEGRLALEATGPVEGWYWQRGALEVRLVEVAGGASRGLKRWPLKAAAPAPGLAAERALDQADALLRKELRPTLIRFATKETP